MLARLKLPQLPRMVGAKAGVNNKQYPRISKDIQDGGSPFAHSLQPGIDGLEVVLHTVVGLGFKPVGVVNLDPKNDNQVKKEEDSEEDSNTFLSASEHPLSSPRLQARSQHAPSHASASWLHKIHIH